MSADHYAQALDHIAAVHEARESLRELFGRQRRNAGDRNPAEVARLNSDLGDALKLADVHATLAVVEAIDNLVDLLDEQRRRVVELVHPGIVAGPVVP